MHINGKIACLGFFTTSLVQVILDRLFLINPVMESVSILARLLSITIVSFPACFVIAWKLSPAPNLPVC